MDVYRLKTVNAYPSGSDLYVRAEVASLTSTSTSGPAVPSNGWAVSLYTHTMQHTKRKRDETHLVSS